MIELESIWDSHITRFWFTMLAGKEASMDGEASLVDLRNVCGGDRGRMSRNQAAKQFRVL